jgi:WD40 repeat protein
MGTVYLARDLKLGRRVALKVLHAHVADAQRAALDLLAEARTTAALSHPNIVGVYSVGAGDPPYLGLEYVEGQSLHERLLARGALSPGEAARVGEGIANGLAAAHRAGVLHRDLKPRNVMLATDGRVRVLDFGLAGALGEPVEASAASATAPGRRRMRGTPAYLAPELWRGEVAGPASDCWALAVVLLQSLSGKNPLSAPSLREIRRRILEAEPSTLTQELGQRAPSLARVLRQALADQPKLRPSAPELAQALAQVRRARGSDEEVLELSPYRGLSPFSQGDAAVFFGRDAEIDELLALLAREPRVAVIGPSGSGKSSLCRAGVLARLAEQGHRTLVLRPGPRPFLRLAQLLRGIDSRAIEPLLQQEPDDELRPFADPSGVIDAPTASLARQLREKPRLLGQALRRLARASGAQLTVLVDQLEELLTQVDQPELRRSFLAALAQAAEEPEEPVRLLLTARDDFATRLVEASGDRAALGRLFVLLPPDEQMLEAALLGPLEAVGYGVDDAALPQEMVAGLRGVRGSLPLLQFTAERLWRQRDRERRLLLREAYERIGGVAGALAQHADRQLARLSDESRELARLLLLRLVVDEHTRRPLPRSRLLDGLPASAEPVLQQLIEARLLVALRPQEEREVVIELAHESLLQRWDTLAAWLVASRDDLRFFREVEPAAQRWQQRDEPRDALWRGDQQLEAEAALRRASSPAPPAVEHFLRAGARARLRRRRGLRVVATAVFVALAAIGLLLAHQEREATRLRHLAERWRADADARRRETELLRAAALRGGVVNALSSGKLLEARAKLRLALELEDSTRGRALWARLQADPRRWSRRVAPSLRAIALLGNRLLATAGQDHDVYLIDPHTAQPQRLLRGHGDKVNALAFASNGRLASAGEDGAIRLWESRGGKLLRQLRGHRRDVLNLGFSPDGKLLASASGDGSLRLWDTARGVELAQTRGQGAAINDVEFSGDGATLYSCGRDGTLWRRQLPKLTGRALFRLRGRPLTRLALHPRQPWVAVTDSSGQIWLLDRHTGQQLRRLRRPARVMALAFSPDGLWLAAGGGDKQVYLWPLSANGPGRGGAIAQAAGTVRALAFSADSRWLVAASRDGAVTLVEPRRPSRADPGHRGPITGLTLSPDGATAATCGEDRTVRLWEVASGRQRALLPTPDKVIDVAYSPDGRLLATGGESGAVRLWRARRPSLIATLKGHARRVYRLRFSRDGRLLASTSYDRTVRLWDVRTRRLVRTLRGHRYFVLDAAFSADGKTLASCGGKAIRLWDLRRLDRPSRVLRAHDFWVYCLAFTSAGGLLSGSFDRSVRRWQLPAGTSQRVLRSAGRVHTVAIHPDKRRIGTCHSDGTARLWSSKGRPLAVLQTHRAEVNRLVFSSDGATAFTAGDDGTLRAHDLASGRPRWRGAALLPAPPRALDHRGWRSLAGASLALAPWQRRALKQQAVRVRAVGAHACLLLPGGVVELWRGSRKRPAATLDARDPARQLLAFSWGCAARSHAGAVRLIRLDGRVKQLPATGARALGHDGAKLLVAGGSRLASFDSAGKVQDMSPLAPGVTALARQRRRLAVGYRNGIVEISQAGSATRLLADTPSEAVRQLRFGPRGTLAVGFGGGSLALWDIESGAQLGRRHLHGSVEHLLFAADRLYALSALGSWLAWDISALRLPHCALLHQIWRRVGVSWRSGRVRRLAPPVDHPCHARGLRGRAGPS